MHILDNILKKGKRRTKKKNQKFNSLKCHPKHFTSKNIKRIKKSCLNDKLLNYMKIIWNKRHPDNKIISKQPKEIWDKMNQNMNGSCSNELCWIENTIQDTRMKNNLKKKLFAPFAPKSWKKNKDEWLSSTDLLNVMKQYEDSYDHFKFFGPSPIDFNSVEYNNECVWPEICNIDIRKLLKQHKTKLGFIFNTDKHYQDGSHWISLFVDLDKHMIFFFDSNGTKEPKEIKTFKKELQEQCLSKCGLNMKLDSNYPFEHQYKDGQCGMYCLYFIISLLKKSHNFEYFKKKRIPDKQVEKLRKIYYNQT